MPRRTPGIRKLSNNHYEIRLKRVNPRTGLQKEVRRRVEGSWEDALAARVEVLAELELDSQPAERQRLRAFASLWLSTRLPKLKPSTAKKYGEALDLHILPTLGDIWVDQIRPVDVQKWVNEQAKNLEGWTVRNQLSVLRTIAKDALAAGVAELDFCARVEPPEVNVYTDEDPNLLSEEELGRLLVAIPMKWYAVVMVLATTGLRWGEVSGLKWEDLDFEEGSIKVRRTNWKGTPVEPKTKRSRRVVALLPEVAQALAYHRTRLVRKENPGLKAGWVFPTRRGRLHRGSPLLKVLRQALERAEIETDVTVHGLRRTFNDIARRIVNREVLKSITGHTTDEMVEHYSRVDLEEKRAAAAGVLRRALGPEVDNRVAN